MKIISFSKADIAKFFALLFFCFILVYFTSPTLSSIAFLVVLIIAYNSKKNYFWLAFLFILVDAPGRLFMPIGERYSLGIPNYQIMGGAFHFYELFLFAYLIKALATRKTYAFVFKTDLKVLLFYLFLTILYTVLLGINASNFIEMSRRLFPLILFYIIPKILNDPDTIYKFDKLVFPVIFLALISQFYTFINGRYFADIFTGAVSVNSDLLLAGGSGAARAYNSVYVILYIFHKALYYQKHKATFFNHYYLNIVLGASIGSLFLSATRGWVLAIIVVLLLTVIYYSNPKKLVQNINLLFVTILGFLLIALIYEPIGIQVVNSFERILTVNEIAKGDLSAGGTSTRLSDRGPRVLTKFDERPILGWGFSDTYFAYADKHVGHHTILLTHGIMGYVLFTFLFIKWFYRLYHLSLRHKIQEYYGKANLIFAFSLLFIYTIHSTSHQFWGFSLGWTTNTYFAFALLLTSFNANIIRAYENINSK